MGESKLITINWPNHHEVFVDGVWSSFLQNFKVDIEVTCNGQHLKAHQLILAIFCPALVSNSESQVFNLDHASLQGDDMDLLLEFIYRGQITLQEERLDKLQKAAKDLGVIGLGEAIDGYRTEGSKAMDEGSEDQRSRRGANRRKRKNTPFKISQQAYDTKDEHPESVSSEGDTSAASHGRKRFRGLHDKNDTDSNSDWNDNDNAEDNGEGWGSNADDVHQDGFDHGVSDGAVSQPDTPATVPKRKRGRKRSGKKLGEGEQSSSEPLSGEALKAARTEYKQKWRQNQPLRKCSFCSYETRDRDSYASHVAKHDPYAERHVCPFCSKSFRSRRGYIRHQSVHVDPASLQKCPQCPFMTPLKSSLIQHVASVHKADLDGNPIDGKFKCEECDFSSMFECQLKLHVLRKHSHERPFKCTECEYGAVLKTDLDKHISIKHRNERNFLCDLCGFCSSSKGGHNRHKRTHTGEKPFQCDICGKKYADSRKWKIHRLRHESDEKPFVCHVCAHACRRKDNLIMHLKRIHKIEKGDGGVTMSDEPKSEETHSRSAPHTQTIVIVGPPISLTQTPENSRSANTSISIPTFIAVDEEHSGEEVGPTIIEESVLDVDSGSIRVQTGPEQESVDEPSASEPSNNATLDAEALSDSVAFYLYAASQELDKNCAM